MIERLTGLWERHAAKQAAKALTPVQRAWISRRSWTTENGTVRTQDPETGRWSTQTIADGVVTLSKGDRKSRTFQDLRAMGAIVRDTEHDRLLSTNAKRRGTAPYRVVGN